MDRTQTVERINDLLDLRGKQADNARLKLSGTLRLIGVDPEVDPRFKDMPSITTAMHGVKEEIEKIDFANLFASDFTDEELAHVKEFYESDLGQRWLKFREMSNRQVNTVTDKFVAFIGSLMMRMHLLMLQGWLVKIVRQYAPDMPQLAALNAVQTLINDQPFYRPITPAEEAALNEQGPKVWGSEEGDYPTGSAFQRVKAWLFGN
jgi:hypothetical protein